MYSLNERNHIILIETNKSNEKLKRGQIKNKNIYINK